MNDITYSFIYRKMNFFLLIMSKYYRLACLYMSGIDGFFTHNHTDKGRLPYSILSDDTDTFVVSKFMREIIQNFFLSKYFFDMFEFEDFASQLSGLHRQGKFCTFIEHGIFEFIIAIIDSMESRRSRIRFCLSATWRSFDPAQFFSI